MRRLVIAIVVMTLVAAALWLLPIKPWLLALLQWTAAHREQAWTLFILTYVIATVCFLPATILTLAAGAIFGLVTGSVLVSIGSTLGATAAFFVGRSVARQWISRRIAAWPRFRALDAALGERGFLIVLLTRLSPAFPFFLLNYAYGVSSVKPRDYIAGSWIGMMPATVAYVYLGTLAASLAQVVSGGAAGASQVGSLRWALLALGVVATITVTVVVTKLASRQLDKSLASGPQLSATSLESRQ
jgi:uncharacterized membrane protein YdjX (TVP38/TMEM64 family)